MDVSKAIDRYCTYQERCHAEARNKLYELGCTKTEVEEHIATLIEAGVLNEERYARAFARGKFRIKHWGKQKIIQHLKLHKISEYCIKKALAEIEVEEYNKTLQTIAEKKWSELQKEKNLYIKKGKLYRYLIQKGFSVTEVNNTMTVLLNP